MESIHVRPTLQHAPRCRTKRSDKPERALSNFHAVATPWLAAGHDSYEKPLRQNQNWNTYMGAN